MPRTVTAHGRDQCPDLAFTMRAGDENRPRTISLGSSAITAARGAELAFLAVPSDRGCPSLPWLMAR